MVTPAGRTRPEVETDLPHEPPEIAGTLAHGAGSVIQLVAYDPAEDRTELARSRLLRALLDSPPYAFFGGDSRSRPRAGMAALALPLDLGGLSTGEDGDAAMGYADSPPPTAARVPWDVASGGASALASLAASGAITPWLSARARYDTEDAAAWGDHRLAGTTHSLAIEQGIHPAGSALRVRLGGRVARDDLAAAELSSLEGELSLGVDATVGGRLTLGANAGHTWRRFDAADVPGGDRRRDSASTGVARLGLDLGAGLVVTATHMRMDQGSSHRAVASRHHVTGLVVSLRY